MAYAVQADLVPRRLSNKELAQLTSDNGADVVVPAVVTDILAEASGTIDSYCSERYAVPLQSSEQIKGIALDIAVYKLFSRKRRNTDEIDKAYDRAIQFLRDVAAGKASLDQPTGASAQTSSGEAVPTQKEERFSNLIAILKGFVQALNGKKR
jgi:phage gp36-like protein